MTADLPAILALAQAALEQSEAFAERIKKDWDGFTCANPRDRRCDCELCHAARTLDACREARDRLAGVV